VRLELARRSSIRPRRLALPLAVGVLVLLIGIGYAATRPPRYESTGRLVLVPTADRGDLPQLLDSVQASGTLGTYVELIQSGETLRRAGSPPIEVRIRAIPNTRVITVTAEGDEGVVQTATRALLATAGRFSRRLGDPWRLSVLEPPSAPTPAPPSTTAILLASVILAALSFIFVAVLMSRLGLEWPRRGSDFERDLFVEVEDEEAVGDPPARP
jgi:hypothetical protein